MPAEPKVSDTQLYHVRPGQPVTLRIGIGNLQLGGASISHEGPPRSFPTGSDELIGHPGQDLRFTILHTVTTVKDINPQTNETVVTYRLSGGVKDQTFEYRLTVNETEGFAHYFIDFALV